MILTLLKHIGRIFLGAVFVFSGYVKAVDPLGSSYKFNDYLTVFGMSWLEPITFPLAILLSTLELGVGLMLVVNVWVKYASWLSLLFMAFFTPLTLWLALQEMISGHEMVHDCGCFGDAWVLTNWETFWKNIVLLIPAVYIFIKRKESKSIFNCKTDAIITGVIVFAGIMISVYAYRHLPQHDFRPYKIGTNIPEGMLIPDGAPQPVYETKLYYKKDGKTEEFTLENYPKEEGWEFVDSKSVLKERGYEPPIHDFTIVSDEEGDITDLVLADTNYSFLVVAYNLPKVSYSNMNKINALYSFCSEQGIGFRGLTASMSEEIERFRDKTGAKFPFYGTDPVTLKTVIRANPGIVLLKNGTVINKWHANDLPEVSEIKEEYFK